MSFALFAPINGVVLFGRNHSIIIIWMSNRLLRTLVTPALSLSPPLFLSFILYRFRSGDTVWPAVADHISFLLLHFFVISYRSFHSIIYLNSALFFALSPSFSSHSLYRFVRRLVLSLSNRLSLRHGRPYHTKTGRNTLWHTHTHKHIILLCFTSQSNKSSGFFLLSNQQSFCFKLYSPCLRIGRRLWFGLPSCLRPIGVVVTIFVLIFAVHYRPISFFTFTRTSSSVELLPEITTMDSIKQVKIDASGRFKYVLLRLNNRWNKKEQLFVRGSADAAFHADLVEQFEEKVYSLKLMHVTCECLGGGRIYINPVERTLNVYGYSQVD